MRPAVLALFLLVAPFVAGCAEPASSDEGRPAAGEETAVAAAGPTASFARFAPDADVDTTVEFTGAFSPQEMGGALADARAVLGADATNVHSHDLSAAIPVGVPARLRLEVSADAGQGDLDAWISMEPHAIWWARGEAPFGGNMWFEYDLMRRTAEPVHVMIRYDEPGEHAQIPYVITADVNADAETLRAGVPAWIEIPPGATALMVESDARSDGAAILVWDAQDAFVGRVPLDAEHTRVELPEDAEGDFLIMLSDGAARARVAVVGATIEPLLRPVEREVVVGEPRRGDSAVSWSFDAARVPIMVGISVRGGEVAHEFEATLSSTAGVVLDARIADDVPWLLGVGFGFLSVPGDPNVVAGGYAAEARFALSAGSTSLDAVEVLVYPKR